MNNKLMIFNKHSLMKRIFLLMFFSFIVASHSFAQSAKSNLGMDFYVAFGKNNQEATITPTGRLNVELVLRIATLEATQVTLSFTNGSVSNRVFTLPADTIFDYILTRSEAIATYTGEFQSNPATSGANKKSVRVTATKPIKLVAVNSANHSYEATLVWPTDSWGTEYYNIGVAPYTTGSHCNGYIVIAKENNTTVSGITGMGGINGPITLNAGEVYFYYNTGSNIDKLGEHIISNKPVAFFNSNTQAMITTGSGTQNNYNLEQLAPVNQWGKEFILPTNKYKAGLFRIYTKDASTVLKFTYTDGSPTNTKTITGAGFHDIRIDGYTNAAAKACYLTSSSPVGVCAFQIPNLPGQSPPQIGAPASAWLPSVKQMTRHVLMSPLDLDGQYAYMAMNHYLTVIVRSSGKNSTTIALNGNAPQPVGSVPNFTWVADNIGGSDYSFGTFKIDSTFVNDGIKAKNKTVLVDNPDGLIALAFSSEGSYATYFYTVGLAYRDLTAGFTINDVDYIDRDGKGACDASNFTFEAYPDSLTNVTWKINGALAGTGKQLFKDDLPEGLVVVEMIANNKTYTCSFFVGGLPVVWTPYTTTGNERYNWNNLANWAPAIVPNSCNNVFIPGNLDYYPNLTDNAVCKKIYFIQGAELGRPDLLTYEKAYVQYNFGLKQEPQKTGNNNMDLVLHSTSTADRMLYSAAVSADPIERERWYMLSSPLKDVLTGDLGFGGFPLTFLKKYDMTENQNYPVGNWTTPYNSMTEPVTSNSTDGFAFFMYGSGNDEGDDTGCEESGYFNDPELNDLDYLPDTRSNESYGIGKINGILELPFFADSTNLYAHRTQVYDTNTNTSKFYYVSSESSTFNVLTGKSDAIERKSNNSNYRFAPEDYDSISGKWVFQEQTNHPVGGLSDGNEFLVGNPYMSSIDMIDFYMDNSTSIYPEYKIWNGHGFDSYSIDPEGEGIATNPLDNSLFVSPMQGFFLTYKGGDEVNFNVKNISTVRPATSSFNLRNARKPAEENTLRIKTKNKYASAHAVIRYKAGASNDFVRGEDSRKLFSPLGYVPEVYSLTGDIPVDINFINNEKDIIIPLGIKTGRTGEIHLSLAGMDNYSKASKIELIDAKENKTIDLTGKSSYSFSFNHTEKGIQNGRFSLRISNSMTALPDIDNSGDINVYGNSKGIYIVSTEPVQRLEVYDLTGRKLYESTLDARYYPLQGNSGNFPLIVKVMTTNKVKTVKIN